MSSSARKKSLPLTREVAFAKQMTEGETGRPHGAAPTNPNGRGGWAKTPHPSRPKAAAPTGHRRGGQGAHIGAPLHDGRGPKKIIPNSSFLRRRKLHISRFRLTAKARSFRCSDSPHATCFAELAQGPQKLLSPISYLNSPLFTLHSPLFPLPPPPPRPPGCRPRRRTRCPRRSPPPRRRGTGPGGRTGGSRPGGCALGRRTGSPPR